MKHHLNWKSVKCKNVVGEDIYLSIPHSLDIHCRGGLLTQILQMPQKKPILFDEAINLLSDKEMELFGSGKVGHEPGQYFWYSDNFVQWISDMGYHIELTGDEFEPYFVNKELV